MLLKRLGVLGILFSKDPKTSQTRFLILHRTLNWTGWELLKGGIEEGESETDALRREIFEEAGLRKIEILKKLDTQLVYWDSLRHAQNELSIFLVKADLNEPISFAHNVINEHDAFEWVTAEETQKKLKFSDTRELVRIAVGELSKLNLKN